MLPQEPALSEHHLLIFLLQVLLLLGLARGCGEVLRRWGHPPLVGEILVGVCLGPTLLGRLFPGFHQSLFPADPIQLAMLETVSWFGVLFLLLETGLEVDVSAAWRQRSSALRIGIIGVIVPLLVGFGLSLWLPDRYLPAPDQRIIFALFLGTTMAISAMVIIARVLHDLDLIKTDFGLLTLCGYAVNDVLAWVIFSLVLAAATQAVFDIRSVLMLLFVTVTFTAMCLTVGLTAVDRAVAYIDTQLPQQPGAVLSFVCCLGLLCGAITQWIGLTALLGFFLAGIMAGQAQTLSERIRQILTQMVHAIFVPLYFASIALRVDFFENFDLFLIAFVSLVSIGGKYLGAWLGAFGTGLSRVDRVSIGIAFTPSGVTGIVVAAVALEYGILTVPVFVAIIFSAIISSLLVAPWLVWSVQRRQEINILDFFLRRAVIPELSSMTRQAAIEELCQVVAEHGHVADAETLSAAVREREELMGTGLGSGLAVPHARLANLTKPVLVFGRSVHGIEWDAPDGLPVHLIFLLLTPIADDGLQLQILAALARAMSHEDVRAQLEQADSEQAVWLVVQETLRAHTLVPVKAEAVKA
jgi:Kef-type K+ transport system membrane component KefB